MTNGTPTGFPENGDPGTGGDYQHHAYVRDANGVPKFFVSSWATDDGKVFIVPASNRAEGATPGFNPGMTIVKNGTLWAFDPEQGFVDTGKPATPLVEFNSDGTLKSAGYNPGTGKWIGDGGPSPDNAKLLPQAVADVQAAAARLSGLF